MATTLMCWSCRERVDGRKATTCGCSALIQTCPDVPTRNWVVTERLGSGGYSNVYRAVGPNGIIGALKVFDKEEDPKITRRARKERKALTALTHPGIVRVMDDGEITRSGRPYIVQEVIEGETLWTLREALTKEWSLRHPELDRPALLRFRVDFAINVMLSVADALGAAHEAGIAHRDVKPDNIMMAKCTSGTLNERWISTWTPRGWFRPIIIDFNISRSFEPTKTETTAGGTWHYGAPEQFAGDQSKVGNNPSQDVYALAVTLFELLTDKTPYQHHKQPINYFEELRFALDILEGRKKPLHLDAENPFVPALIQNVVSRALSGNPDVRYPTAPHFGLALARATMGDSMHDDFSGIVSIHTCRSRLIDAVSKLRGRLAPNHRPALESTLWFILPQSSDGNTDTVTTEGGNALCIAPNGLFIAPKAACEHREQLTLGRPGGGLVVVEPDGSPTSLKLEHLGLALLRVRNSGPEPFQQLEPFPATVLPENITRTGTPKKAYVLGFRNVATTARHARGLRPTWTEIRVSDNTGDDADEPIFHFGYASHLFDPHFLACPVVDFEGRVLGIVIHLGINDGKAARTANLARAVRHSLSRKIGAGKIYNLDTVLSDEDVVAASCFVRAVVAPKGDPSAVDELRASTVNRAFARYAHIEIAVRSKTETDTLHSLLAAASTPGPARDPLMLAAVKSCVRSLKVSKDTLAVVADKTGAYADAKVTIGRLLLACGEASSATSYLQHPAARPLLAAAHLMLGALPAAREYLERAGDGLLAEGLRAIVDARTGYYTVTMGLLEKQQALSEELRVFPGAWALFLHACSLALVGCSRGDDERKHVDWNESIRFLTEAITELRNCKKKPALDEEDMIAGWCRVFTSGRTGAHLSSEEAAFVLRLEERWLGALELEVVCTDAYLRGFLDSHRDATMRALPGSSAIDRLRSRSDKGARHRLRYAYALFKSDQYRASLAQIGLIDRPLTLTKEEKLLWTQCVGFSLFALVAEEMVGSAPRRWSTRLADAECAIDVEWEPPPVPPAAPIAELMRLLDRREEQVHEAEKTIQDMESRLGETQRAHEAELSALRKQPRGRKSEFPRSK